MADDYEVDVLGDFDFKADSNMYDINELPSKSADLLPEYTNPPWMLEQGWSLDSSMDEKSKATIEKMLLEEQFYVNGKTTGHVRKKNQEKPPANYQKRSIWTEEEKRLFHQGLELYGRSWTKIASVIPTRSSIQIKNFAHQYFKKKEKVQDILFDVNGAQTKVETDEDSLDPFAETVAKVTTASPTVHEVSSANEQISLMDKNRYGKKCHVKDVIQKQNSRSTEGKKRNHNKDRNVMKTEGIRDENKLNSRELKVVSTYAGSDDISGDINIIPISSDDIDVHAGCDEMEDVDVDIETDQDDINHILQSRSTSPNSVYEKLISQAAQNGPTSSHSERENLMSQAAESYSTSSDLVHEKLISQAAQITDQSVQLGDSECSKLKHSNKCITGDDDAISCVSLTDTNEVCRENLSHCDESSPNTERIDTDIPENKDSNSSTDTEQGCQENSPLQYVNAALDCEGNLVNFPIPTIELELDISVVTEHEKKFHKDFFERRSLMKTPERYTKIRNFLLEAWKKSKPCYLRKTSVRAGLKNCGDVNCIGRVHAYLECIGAINFDCDEVLYKHPRSISHLSHREKSKEYKSEVSTAKLEAMRPRKRKIKDEFGVWIDEKELEGQTIEHKHKEEGKEVKQPKQSRPVYDPFKLVPCLFFTDTCLPPFQVEIHTSCLCLMDIHSHISKTEVIGLLGGRFSTEGRQLCIQKAVPCNSISTGLQCEMDPVSQTQASEEIQGCGLEVVGWYHSHPTFAPNPSVRDIETQIKFQDWFSKGGSHFVSVIVSPYNPRNTELCSEVNCLTVSQEFSTIFNCNTPYKFVYTTVQSDSCELSDIIPAAQHLASNYTTDPHRVDLTSTYSDGVTCMDKMLESLRVHNTAEDMSGFLARIRDIFSGADDS